MRSARDSSPDPTQTSGSACSAQATCSPWYLASADALPESHPRPRATYGSLGRPHVRQFARAPGARLLQTAPFWGYRFIQTVHLLLYGKIINLNKRGSRK